MCLVGLLAFAGKFKRRSRLDGFLPLLLEASQHVNTTERAIVGIVFRMEQLAVASEPIRLSLRGEAFLAL